VLSVQWLYRLRRCSDASAAQVLYDANRLDIIAKMVVGSRVAARVVARFDHDSKAKAVATATLDGIGREDDRLDLEHRTRRRSLRHRRRYIVNDPLLRRLRWRCHICSEESGFNYDELMVDGEIFAVFSASRAAVLWTPATHASAFVVPAPSVN